MGLTKAAENQLQVTQDHQQSCGGRLELEAPLTAVAVQASHAVQQMDPNALDAERGERGERGEGKGVAAGLLGQTAACEWAEEV